MQTELIFSPSAEIETELLAVLAADSQTAKGPESKPLPVLLTADETLKTAAAAVLASGEYKAGANETVLLHSPAGLKAKRLLIVGLGKLAKVKEQGVRNAAGTAVRYAKPRGIRELTLVLPEADELDAAVAVRAIAEGAIVGDFDADTYKSDRKEVSVERFRLTVPQSVDKASLERAFAEGVIIGESQNFTRSLVNEPGNKLTPTVLGQRAAEMAQSVGLGWDVYSTEKLHELKMGAFWAVAQGSAEPPALIVLRYEPESVTDGPILGLVGKGITFDTGGISIKPSDNMEKMKYDMAGGAAMLGAMRAIALLKPKVRVIAVVCAAENMPDGKAYKPGDVQTAMSGKTIEIINTDAEGRLVLADGIIYARQLGATHLIDAATLTGAIGVALLATVPTSSPVYGIVNAFPGAGPTTIVTPWTSANDPGDPDSADYDLVTCYCTQVVNESSAMLRLDQIFSEKSTGFLRFNYDRSVNTQPLSASATDLQQKVSAPVNGALELLHIFNPHFVNEAVAGFNRSTDNQYNSSDSGIIYQVAISGGPGPGFVTENYDYTSIYVGNSLSGVDNLTWTWGGQTLKAGVEFRHIQLNQEYGQHGKMTFSNVVNLADDAVKKASLTGALPVNHLRKNDYFVYAQDEFKLRANLNLNLGLRYTIFDLFQEANGLANPFDFSTCGVQGFCGVGASFGQQNYGDIDPRVAFAWTPWKSGQTVIRGGFGIYHEDGQLDDQNLPAKNEVPSYSATGSSQSPISYTGAHSDSRNSTCPGPIVVTGTSNCGFGAGTLSPNAEQRGRKDSYVEQWSFSAQRELPANFVGTVSYLGSHGVHLLETSVVNLLEPNPNVPNSATNPSTWVAQFPAFAPAIGWRGSVGMSTYHGLSVAMRRSFTRGLLVTANYMWSHEIDNGSNGSGDGDEVDPQDALCQACDTASGAWDARHVVNGNAVYQLPFGLGKPMLNQRGIAGAIAGNWQLTATALARTGFPVNVLMPSSYIAPDGNSGTQRPDLVPGVSLTPPGGKTVAQWINPAAFTTPVITATKWYGDAPRDLVRGPGTWQIDMGAAKTFSLTESKRLEFRSEFYNIFNHPQLGQPQATCNLSSSNPAGCSTGFGSIIDTVNTSVSPITPVGSGTPREMQFALRLEF